MISPKAKTSPAVSIFDFTGFFFEVVVSGGDNDAFFRVKREACKVLGLVEDWLDHFEQFVAGQRGTYVVGAPADCEVAVFAVFSDKVVLQGFEKPKERVRCDNKTQPSRGAALHYTRNNAVEEGLEASRGVNSIVVEEKGIEEMEEPTWKTIGLKHF